MDVHATFDAVESSEHETTRSQHCDTMENSHNVPLIRDVTEVEPGTDLELQQEPGLPQEQSSNPESELEPTLEPELGQQRLSVFDTLHGCVHTMH